jgi:hypothetical protein
MSRSELQNRLMLGTYLLLNIFGHRHDRFRSRLYLGDLGSGLFVDLKTAYSHRVCRVSLYRNNCRPKANR